MLNWKKKLGALVPGEARAHLQNALTVEWSGHKTVLVEVPQARPKDDDVELSPFDDGAGQYGRLIDEDDDEEDGRAGSRKFVRARLGRGRSSTLQASGGSGPSESRSVSHPTGLHARSESTPTYYRSEYRSSSSRYTPADEDLLEGDVFAGPAPADDRRPNPFANPFSHADDHAIAATFRSRSPSHGYTRAASSAAPPRPARPLIDPSDWDDVDIVKSPTSSNGSGASSALSRPPGHDYSDRRW